VSGSCRALPVGPRRPVAPGLWRRAGHADRRAGHPEPGTDLQGGVAIARSIHDARQRLADMLFVCDPTATASADITAFTPTHTVARHSGTVADLFADLTTGTPDRTVHARPLVGLTTPRPADGR